LLPQRSPLQEQYHTEAVAVYHRRNLLLDRKYSADPNLQLFERSPFLSAIMNGSIKKQKGATLVPSDSLHGSTTSSASRPWFCCRPSVIYFNFFLLLSAVTAALAAVMTVMYNNLQHLIKSSMVHVDEDLQINNETLSILLNNSTISKADIMSLFIEQQEELDSLQKQVNWTTFALNSSVAELNQLVAEYANKTQDVHNSESNLIAIQFAGTFAILGTLISVWHIMTHYRKFFKPSCQRKVVVILWLVPIFSIFSWMSLVFPVAKGWLDAIKDCYEAYAIYMFISLLIEVLGKGDRGRVISLLQVHADHLSPPMTWSGFFCPCMKHVKDKMKYYDRNPRAKAEDYLNQCQFFAMQFFFIRPLTSICMSTLDDIIGDGHNWDPKYAQFYFNMLANASMSFAFAGLLRFYHATRWDLAWISPFSKFMCIKGIVFLTFWQGVLLSFLASAIMGAMSPIRVSDKNHVLEFSKKANAFLLCLEMFFFAIAHIFIFPTEEWQEGYKEAFLKKKKSTEEDGSKMAWKDFMSDVQTLIKNRKTYLDKRKEGGMIDDKYDDVDIEWKDGWGRIQKFIIEEVDGISILKEVDGEEGDHHNKASTTGLDQPTEDNDNPKSPSTTTSSSKNDSSPNDLRLEIV